MFEIDYEDYKNSIAIEKKESSKRFLPTLTVKDSKGCYLISDDGKRYLDMNSSSDYLPFGHSYEVPKSLDSSNFGSAVQLEKVICDLTGLEKAYFFSSSNMHLYEVLKNVIEKNAVITEKTKILISSGVKSQMNYGFQSFEKLSLNNNSALKTFVNKNTAAVIVEIVQIDSEIRIADAEYLEQLKELCNKNKVLLVFDASSVSPLRTGTGFFNYNANIKPDILVLPRGMSNGFPFSGLVLSEHLNFDSNISFNDCMSQAFDRHKMRAFDNVLGLIEDCTKKNLPEVIASNIAYIEKRFEEIQNQYITIADVRAHGSLLTIIVDNLAYEIADECFKSGVILDVLDENTIKLSPPYIIGKEEIETLINVFQNALHKFARFDRL